MEVTPEILHELHVTCVRALRKYIAQANRTCKVLAGITSFPVPLSVQTKILEQRLAENAAHASYQDARNSLFDAARWNEETV